MRCLNEILGLILFVWLSSGLIFAQSNFDLTDNLSIETPLTVELPVAGPDAPHVVALRDDRVVTLELDYVAGNPWTPFDMGSDELGPVGYHVSWWPLLDPTHTKSKITSLRRTQIQPLLNRTPYVIQVQYVNRLGQIVGDLAQGIVYGGSADRVTKLRKRMTGFFDDFNQPEGLPDERRWNTAFSKINDPNLQGFFVNSQFHSHTLVGTPYSGFGDRGQTVHRVRNPMHLGQGETRRIVFDLDGVGVAGRTVWYLDLHSLETDITSHFAIEGGEGFVGHPSPGLRFRLVDQEVSLWELNELGEQILIERHSGLDWDGRQTFPNVRRQMVILVSETHVTMLMDDQFVLNSKLGDAALSPGDYTVHWTAFGYNTMKVNLPYMILHWDNFGFDGPPANELVNNYRSQIAGTDYVESVNFQPQTVSVEIPDDLQPTDSNTLGEATLFFTRQMATFSPAALDPSDSVNVNGVDFAIPAPVSTATPSVPLTTLVNANSAYSTSISLGTVGVDGTAPLLQGNNDIVFAAAQSGFNNVHIEIAYPQGTEVAYTPPQDIHFAPVHHDFQQVGLPARIAHIGETEVYDFVEGLSEQTNFNPTVSGSVDIRTIVNGDEFTGQQKLRSNFVSPQLAGNGENPGVCRVELWIRPNDAPETNAILVGAIDTDQEIPAPQVAHTFELDTTSFSNGTYELFVIAIDSRFIESMPGYADAGDVAGQSTALNGLYYPLHVTIDNE